MKNFDIKSILLGIGIGFVIVSLLGMIYSLGYTDKSKKLTKEEVVQKAEEFGIIEKSHMVGK
jgi:hypothetical protein